MPDFIIKSLRGGVSEGPPTDIDDDQCVEATNVEFWRSTLGERRLGCEGIDLTGSPVSGCDRIVWLYRHLPTTDPSAAQLWVMGITDPSTVVLCYKNTTWHTVTMGDALTVDGVSEYQVQGQTLHGKLFIAYNSAVDRMHVFITGATALRRTGIAEPAAAPTAANAGVGTFSGTRYYRVRFTEQSGGVTLRRSEPSTALTFAPSGTGASVTVTRPTAVSEGETHWELEASVDNANFYVIATTLLATTTASDTTAYSTGYGVSFDLSEDIGDYELVPSGRYLTADQDRLVIGGSFEDSALASRVMWTPVYADPGDGNDERIPVDTVNYLDLDGFEGGPLTGMSAAVNGYVYAFKQSHVYQMARTGVRTRSYEAIPLTKKRGALPGSIIEALDEVGDPTLFCLDPDIGPVHISARGVEPCGVDVAVTWETVNLDATKIVARSIYFQEKQQLHWWIATGSSNVPDTRIVLHANEMRNVDFGAKRGWVVWDGPSASILSTCMFSSNIDAGTARSAVLKPFVGVEGNGLIWLTDTGNDDNGTDYFATIITKPFVHGSLLNQFECKSAALLAKAATGALIDITIIANFGLYEYEVTDVSFTPTGTEDRIIYILDNLSLAELNTVQIKFADTASPGAQWSLEQFAMREEKGEQAQ